MCNGATHERQLADIVNSSASAVCDSAVRKCQASLIVDAAAHAIRECYSLDVKLDIREHVQDTALLARGNDCRVGSVTDDVQVLLHLEFGSRETVRAGWQNNGVTCW